MPSGTVRQCTPRSRHGRIKLFAAQSYLDGKVVSQTAVRHTHVEWLRFLKHIDRECPGDLALHLIVDNYATLKHSEVRAWMAKHPRFHMHFTPTSSSCVNIVGILCDLTVDVARQGSFTRANGLGYAISQYLDERSLNPT